MRWGLVVVGILFAWFTLILSGVTTTATGIPSAQLAAWSILALALGAVAAWCVALWLASRRLQALHDELSRGAHDKVLRQSKRLLAWPGVGARAALIHLVALINDGKPTRAEGFLHDLRPELRPTGAVLHYLHAALSLESGDETTALLHLHDCLHLDGMYAVLAARHARLGPLLDRIPTPDPES